MMKDILDGIRCTDPVVFPVFAAKSIGNMPPISRNYVKMASIMVELAQLRSDVSSIQEKESQLRSLADVISDLKRQIANLSAA